MDQFTDRPEMLSESELAEKIETEFVGRTLYYYDETTSTNEDAKRLALEAALDGTLVVAEAQTKGKGRRGREWESPAGKSVYFSLLMRPDIPVDSVSRLTLVMALSVAEAVEKVCGERQAMASYPNGPGADRQIVAEGSAQVKRDILSEDRQTETAHPMNENWDVDSMDRQAAVQIKWPNDIVMDGKKVCGILTELLLEAGRVQGVVIGVGINVNQGSRSEFPEPIREFAGSVRMACGKEKSRADLIAGVMQAFEENYKIFLKTCDLTGVKAAYEARLANMDMQVKVLDPKGEYAGIARGINTCGELLVEKEDGSMVAVYAGEVSVRGLYGYV